MPLIALIGTEAPGRVEWALRQRADAHLVKPVGNAGIYSALLIARQKFEERKALYREIDSLRGQVAERRTVVQAVLRLTERGQTEAEAFALLRRLAMDGQTTLEAAAARLLGDSDGGAHERSGRP
jgi:AmiR/NasT family two-component response regulator